MTKVLVLRGLFASIVDMFEHLSRKKGNTRRNMTSPLTGKTFLLLDHYYRFDSRIEVNFLFLLFSCHVALKRLSFS